MLGWSRKSLMTSTNFDPTRIQFSQVEVKNNKQQVDVSIKNEYQDKKSIEYLRSCLADQNSINDL